MTDKSAIDDHRLIVQFALTRLFPMLDEFAAANALRVSADQGMLILLTERLVRLGHPEGEVIEAVRQAAERAGERHRRAVPDTLPPSPPEPTEPVAPPDEGADNVVQFRRP